MITKEMLLFYLLLDINHNIKFNTFKENLKNILIIKENINIHTNEKNKLQHFGIFIIMYEIF